MREKHIKDYPEIFMGSLEGAHMNIPPVDIELKTSGFKKLKPTTTACEVPILWRPSVRDLIQQFIKDKAIELKKTTSEICSRSAFILNTDGDSLRLVTNFRGGNRTINCPV